LLLSGRLNASLSQGRPSDGALFYSGIFLFWQDFPGFSGGLRAEFRVSHAAAVSAETSARSTSLAWRMVRRFLGARVGLLALAMTAEATSPQTRRVPAMLLIGAIFMLLNVTLSGSLVPWLERLLARRRAREIFLAFLFSR